MGPDWLNALRYKNIQPIERGECKVNTKFAKCTETVNEISPEKKSSLNIFIFVQTERWGKEF